MVKRLMMYFGGVPRQSQLNLIAINILKSTTAIYGNLLFIISQLEAMYYNANDKCSKIFTCRDLYVFPHN